MALQWRTHVDGSEIVMPKPGLQAKEALAVGANLEFDILRALAGIPVACQVASSQI